MLGVNIAVYLVRVDHNMKIVRSSVQLCADVYCVVEGTTPCGCMIEGTTNYKGATTNRVVQKGRILCRYGTTPHCA